MDTSQVIDFSKLSKLAELFKLLNSGRHLNRLNQAALWAELEQNKQAYIQVFANLGFNLIIDNRDFAWFENVDTTSIINKTSRQLALLFMIIFDTQADAGIPLNRFTEWRLDKEFFSKAYEQYKDLLEAEDINLEDFIKLLDAAARLGFMQDNSGYWELLPAVFRYLDHLEHLAELARKEEEIL